MLLLDAYEIGQLPERFENEIIRWPRYPQKGDDSAYLIFDLVTQRFEYVGAKGSSGPVINGVPVTEPKLVRQLKANDLIRWRKCAFALSRSVEPSKEEQRVLAIVQADPKERAVYSDWLEARGADQCAEYVRLCGEAPSEGRDERMASVASRVSLSFRAMVATGPIERCHLGACPGRWEALPFSAAQPQGFEALNPVISVSTRLSPSVFSTRQCFECSSGVRFIARPALAHTHPGPVVVEPSCPRKPNDLVPPRGLQERPIVGRPLVVDGAARSAQAVGLGASRSKLIDELTRAALDEHASIATFARTICELMALGAPLSLLEATQQAMGDEIRHAAMTFEQIERLGGGHWRASVLPEAVSPMRRSVAELRADVQRGAEGEAANVEIARRQADETDDPSLRAFYSAIADDEERHAALATETVRWLGTVSAGG